MKNQFCLLRFFGNTLPGSGMDLIQCLSTPAFRPADTGVRRQSLTRWDGEGLLHTSRMESKGWRSFSPVELVWLLTVQQMRKMSLPFDLISEVRSTLFRPILPQEWRKAGTTKPGRFVRDGLVTLTPATQKAIAAKEGISLLLGLIAQSIRLKSHLVLRIFPDGKILPRFNGSERQLRSREIQKLNSGSYISLPLTPIIREHLFTSQPDFENEIPPSFCEKDRKILDLIHSGNIRSLELNFEKGIPVEAQTCRQYPPETSFTEIPESEAGEIKILRAEGVITAIEYRSQIRF